ncbi:MAG: hypothetical protein JW929_04505 [Anaerolineales bacterium]|nr:hypothetical protein [Anaerolineales bacterium]
MRKHILPVLTLFLLSPVVGELVSGSAPPAQWLDPSTWIVMVPLYGAGALLARELFVRWRSGWLGAVLLGSAYGILEEGIDVMSFFNTAWPDLGASAAYGRWADVSWVWAVQLTAYHAAFSIAIPILIVHLIFPKARGESWLGCFGLAAFGILLAAVVLTGNLLFRSVFSYSPPPLPYCGSIAAVLALVFLARRIRPPAPDSALEAKPLPHPFLYGLAGFGATVVLFYAGWVLTKSDFPPIPTVLIILADGAAVAGLLARSHRHGRQFTDTRKLALAIGGLLLFIALSPVIELQGINEATGENPGGMVCVGLSAFFLLALLSVFVWNRERRAAHPRLTDTFTRD